MFFCDILIYSPTLTDEVSHLSHVFSYLAKENYSLKFSKCLFVQEQIEYLGCIISSQGVAPDNSEIGERSHPKFLNNYEVHGLSIGDFLKIRIL